MEARERPSRPLRVLVIEDEPVIGIDLAERLSENGYSILGPFSRCAEVNEWLAHDVPDAAVINLHLADGSCEHGVRLLRGFGVAIVVFTGKDQIPEDLTDVVVVTKPAPVDHVVAALKKLTVG